MSSGQILYLLDTNVVSDLRRPRPDPAVTAWVERQPARSLAIAWSTVFEIQYGAELARSQHPEHATGLEGWLEGFVLSGRFRIVKPCAASVRIRARMHATPALRGFLDSAPGARRPANGEDLTIAATAIAAGAVVVTMDDGDFASIHRHFPLPGLLNPQSGIWAVACRVTGAIEPLGSRYGTRSFAKWDGSSRRRINLRRGGLSLGSATVRRARAQP